MPSKKNTSIYIRVNQWNTKCKFEQILMSQTSESIYKCTILQIKRINLVGINSRKIVTSF